MLADSVKNKLKTWHNKAVGKGKKKALKAAPFCLLWIVWKRTNHVAFEDQDFNIQKWEVKLLANQMDNDCQNILIEFFLDCSNSDLMHFIECIGSIFFYYTYVLNRTP